MSSATLSRASSSLAWSVPLSVSGLDDCHTPCNSLHLAEPPLASRRGSHCGQRPERSRVTLCCEADLLSTLGGWPLPRSVTSREKMLLPLWCPSCNPHLCAPWTKNAGRGGTRGCSPASPSYTHRPGDRSRSRIADRIRTTTTVSGGSSHWVPRTSVRITGEHLLKMLLPRKLTHTQVMAR